MVSESIKNRRLQIDPKIIVDIVLDEHDPYFLNLVVENVGNGVALNLKFNIKNEWKLSKAKMLKDIGFIKNGLKSLSGKTKYKTLFVFLIDENIDIFKESMEIEVEYEDISKRKYMEKIIFDLSYLSDITYTRNRPENKIVKEMKELSKSIKQISQYLSTIAKEK